MTPSEERKEAARLLAAWFRERRPGDALLDRLGPGRRAGIQKLLYAALRHHRSLTWLTGRLTQRRPPRLTTACLHIGLVELLFLGVPEHASVHENVEGAKALIGRRGAGFINAVLRRAQREREPLLAELEQQPPGIRLSHPDRIWERWVDHFGSQEAEALCHWNNREPELALRPMQDRMEPEALQALFQQAGIETLPHPAAPEEMLLLPHGVRIVDLPGYAEGWFTLQDPSTLLAPHLLAPRPGEHILDACAAPGGKTAVLSDLMKGRGRITALEPRAERLTRLQENLKRLERSHVEAFPADATTWQVPEGESLDGILLDVPCSNTGVYRRRPDARWAFSPKRLQRMIEIQMQLLDHAAGLLRPGGRLVYSTCSLEREENEGLITAWLTRHPAFLRESERFSFPPASGMDGAYAARLVKTG